MPAAIRCGHFNYCHYYRLAVIINGLTYYSFDLVDPDRLE